MIKPRFIVFILECYVESRPGVPAVQWFRNVRFLKNILIKEFY